MSDATWSMMTRRRASSLAASFQDGRSTASSVDGLKPRQVLNDLNSSRVETIVTDVDGTASAHRFYATPTILLNHKGQAPQVVSVGVPNLATLDSQINSAIGT